MALAHWLLAAALGCAGAPVVAQPAETNSSTLAAQPFTVLVTQDASAYAKRYGLFSVGGLQQALARAFLDASALQQTLGRPLEVSITELRVQQASPEYGLRSSYLSGELAAKGPRGSRVAEAIYAELPSKTEHVDVALYDAFARDVIAKLPAVVERVTTLEVPAQPVAQARFKVVGQPTQPRVGGPSPFEADDLERRIRRKLETEKLVVAQAGRVLDVEVTEVRLRPDVAFASDPSDFSKRPETSGSDYIRGVAVLKTLDGEVLKRKDIDASMSYWSISARIKVNNDRFASLYDEFASHVAAVVYPALNETE